MLNDSERVELEWYRSRDRFSAILWGTVAAVALLAIASCTVGAYKADAFISHRGSLNFEVDILKTYCYMSGKCPVRHTPEALGVSIPSRAASAVSAGTGFRELQLPQPSPEVPASR